MIFLAQIEYREMHYQGKICYLSATKLVHAETADDVEQKVIDFYDKKSREYDVYYSVRSVEVEEPIL